MVAIDIRNLSKSYGSICAVNNISFQVKEDSFTAFLGKNGAGKSTTINMLATLLKKDQGDVTIFNCKLGEQDEQIRAFIGVVFQQNMLDLSLSVYENLKVRAALYGLNGTALEERITLIGSQIGILDFLKQPYGDLSGGQRRKADIARALLHQPRLLILDEPTTGLDPKSRKEIWQFIQKLRQESNMTVLLTTHYLEEVYDADHVVVIDKGQLVDEGSSAELRAKYTKTKLFVTFFKQNESEFATHSHVYKQQEGRWQFRFSTSFEALDFVNQHRNKIQHFEIIQGTMDDVFLSLTKEDV